MPGFEFNSLRFISRNKTRSTNYLALKQMFLVLLQFHAMDVLHQHDYDIVSSLQDLVPPTGPKLCRDQMEEWSASEANLFEEALDKYGKSFRDIWKDYVR